MGTHYETRGDVALLTLANPPVNGLDLKTRQELAAGVERALADTAVVAIVVSGAGKAFSGGADIREFGSPKAEQDPNAPSLVRLLENCAKPVVMALHGACMGGGLEIALGAHYRVAVESTSIALPEVKLGLIPGAGGTQRLPRVLGLETALNMVVSGEPVPAKVLATQPDQKLFDRVVGTDEELLDAACALARDAAAKPGPYPRVRDLSVAHSDADGYLAFARNMVRGQAKGLPAPLKAIDAVEAALRKPFEEGLRFELQTFLALMTTPESRALRHAFLAERAAGKIPDVADDTPQRPVRRVGVIGAGTMGSGIAMVFLEAGLPVTLLETKPEALERGVAHIRKTYEGQLKKGRLKQDKLDARLALLSTSLEYAAIADADLVIEAVFEDLDVKEQVFRQLDAVMRPGAILASNTSTLDLNRIADFTQRPQDVVGLHFFSPANVMKLLEVVRGAKTSPDVLATAMGLARKIRKTAVVSGVCDGFIGNRMIEQYTRQAGFLLDEGCTPQQVDKAMERWGMAMGPFRVGDLAGNDIGHAIRKRRRAEQPDMRYSATADLLCEMGRFGQKTGAGWYDYKPGQRDPVPSPVVAEMIEKHRAAAGIQPRKVSDDEIVQRLVYALVNEAAHILEEGIASRAGDIDMVYLTGYGFPLFRGGPMCYTDEQGLFNVVQAMKRFATNPLDDAAFWQPAPLLARLAAEGKRFT